MAQWKHKLSDPWILLLSAAWLLGVVSLVFAQDDSGSTVGECATDTATCNEKRPDPDPEYCLDPFTRCEDKTWAACMTYAALCDPIPDPGEFERVIIGEYSKKVPKTCVACTAEERAAGGACNCKHCRTNDPEADPPEENAVCYESKACRWDLMEEMCISDVLCSTARTSVKIHVDCPP